MKELQLLTSIVSLCTSLVNLVAGIITYKKLIADQKQKNPNPVATDKDSK